MKLVGVVLVICGAILGLYVGVWLCFVGGIVDVIQQIRAEYLDATAVACGVAKIVFAGVLGTLSGAVLAVPGWLMLND